MASLYIKDPDTADRAARVARRLGTSKTDAVRRALVALEAGLPAEPETDIVARLRAWQERNPLGEPTGLDADKAFFDSLYEDEE